MRMRKRRNLGPRMERCSELLISEPETRKGTWRSLYPDCEKLLLELGCGKGRFTAETARLEPENLLIAVERVPAAMILAMERVKAAGLENVRFIDADAKLLEEMFSAGEVDRIYINFCDPWPKKKQARRRLVHRDFLAVYSVLLKDGGAVIFKTDNAPLFDFALEEAAASHFLISGVSRDLAASGIPNITTEYEEKFMALGTPIHRAVFTKN